MTTAVVSCNADCSVVAVTFTVGGTVGVMPVEAHATASDTCIGTPSLSESLDHPPLVPGWAPVDLGLALIGVLP
jgi:hypothetical protein